MTSQDLVQVRQVWWPICALQVDRGRRNKRSGRSLATRHREQCDHRRVHAKQAERLKTRVPPVLELLPTCSRTHGPRAPPAAHLYHNQDQTASITMEKFGVLAFFVWLGSGRHGAVDFVGLVARVPTKGEGAPQCCAQDSRGSPARLPPPLPHSSPSAWRCTSL